MFRHFLALSLLLLPGLAHAQAPSLAVPGKLTWGSSPTFPPFEFEDNGKPAGFDVDFAELVAKQAGLQSAILPIEFKGLIPALLGHRIDAIFSGMYQNPQREEVADFVSYILVGNQIVVRKGNPLNVQDRASLCGRRVAAPLGTVFEISAKQVSADCKAAGKPELSLLTLAGTSTCALALTQDRADAIIVSTPTVAALIRESPEAYDAAGAPFDADTKIGIAIGKDNPGLKSALQTAVHAVVADGSYATLLKKWNLAPSSSPF